MPAGVRWVFSALVGALRIAADWLALANWYAAESGRLPVLQLSLLPVMFPALSNVNVWVRIVAPATLLYVTNVLVLIGDPE